MSGETATEPCWPMLKASLEQACNEASRVVEDGQTPRYAELTPREFIIAFGGVVCLVFEGFPVVLEQFKGDVLEPVLADVARRSGTAAAVRSENMGSKWCKVSLGAFDDSCGTIAVDDAFAQEVIACCRASSQALQAGGSERVVVTTLSLVEIQTRDSKHRTDVLYLPAPTAIGDSDPTRISEAMLAKTIDVTSDFYRDAASYLSTQLNAKRSPASHYVKAMAAVDRSLVIDLNRQGAELPRLHECIATFKANLDALLTKAGHPGAIHWFDVEALHATVRAV